MGISIRPSRALFAAVMIGLGIIGLIYGNSALIWESIPKTLPDRPVIIYLCAVIEIGTGSGLLLRPSVILACRRGWTYLTAAGSLAAAAGMLFGVYPRLAANLEAAMLWIITLLVWVPRVASMPRDQGDWTEFFISSAIATGTWVVADTYRSVPWLASGKGAHAVSPD